jgi:hypothetical protein
MAKGTVIKKIIDDDVFDYASIRACADFMLANPGIDVVISNDYSVTIHEPKKMSIHSRLSQFNAWKAGQTASFTFGDVHLLIRRSALAYIGLYNTAYVMMDWEYALRISFLRIKIAYYTGYNALSVGHPQTVSALKDVKKVKMQTQRAEIFYDYHGDRAELSYWSKIKIGIGKIIYANKSNRQNHEQGAIDLEKTYVHFYQFLSIENNRQQFEFIKSE